MTHTSAAETLQRPYRNGPRANFSPLRLSALMDLYIHPLKGIFHPSHRKIYSFPAFIHPLYHPLSTVGPLVTLFKYIHMTSCFEEFIETNLMA
jgi:hypothetical protein